MSGAAQIRAAVAIAGMSLPIAAGAAQWVLESGAGVRTEYNDNVFLTERNKRSGWSTSLGPSLRANRNTEVSTLGLSAGVAYVRNTFGNPKDNWNASLGANGSYRTERTTYTGSLGFLRDSTLASEVFRTGVVTERVQRNAFNAQLGVSRSLTERWSANAGVSFARSRYDETGSNGLNDSDVIAGSAGVSYTLSPQTQVFTSLQLSRFESSPIKNTFETGSLSVGASHQFTERLRISGSAGYYRQRSDIQALFVCQILELAQTQAGFVLVAQQYAQSECFGAGIPLTRVAVGREETSNGAVYDAALTWQLDPRTTISGFARQGFTPTGTGVLVRNRAFGAALAHQWTERLRALVDAQAVRASFAGGFGGGPESWLYFVLARVVYDLSREWSVEAGYRHTMIDYLGGGQGTVNQNAVYAFVRYDFPRMAISR